MEAYFGRNRSKQALYQYYYIKHRYYEARLKKEKQEHQTIDTQLLDSEKMRKRELTIICFVGVHFCRANPTVAIILPVKIILQRYEKRQPNKKCNMKFGKE